MANTTTSYYLGKRIAFVYRAPKEIRGTKIRAIWGKVTRTHGSFWIYRAGNFACSNNNQATPAS